MAARRPIDEKVEQAKLEAQQKQNRLKQLLQQQKEEKRKERTKRLCARAGLLEKLMPETIELTEEQFYQFLTQAVVNDYGRRTAQRIAALGEDTKADMESEKPNPSDEVKTPKAATQSPSSGNTADTPNTKSADVKPNGTDTAAASAKPNSPTPAQTEAKPNSGIAQQAGVKPNSSSVTPSGAKQIASGNTQSAGGNTAK